MIPLERLPDLDLLRNSANRAEWVYAIDWLWPGALIAVKEKLGQFFPGDVEDVAMEALAAAVGKLDEISHIRELKLLTITLARNKAVDFLRRSLAEKRGKGKVKSLEQLQEDNPEALEACKTTAILAPLDKDELMRLLESLIATLGFQEVTILRAFYLSELAYSEIVEQFGIPMGTIGAVLQRALKKLRKRIAKSPKIMKELKEYLQ